MRPLTVAVMRPLTVAVKKSVRVRNLFSLISKSVRVKSFRTPPKLKIRVSVMEEVWIMVCYAQGGVGSGHEYDPIYPITS